MRAARLIVGVSQVALVTLTVLTTAGCATAPGPPVGTAATRAASPAAASPSPTGPVLGRPAPANNGQVEATVYEYRQGAADVQVCVVRTAIFDVTISRGPWQLLLPGGPALAPTPAPGPGAPQPGYPTDHRRVAPGECVRGWLVFPLPSGAAPVAIQYAPTGAQPVTWVLS
jgi:hypothetical protein